MTVQGVRKEIFVAFTDDFEALSEVIHEGALEEDAWFSALRAIAARIDAKHLCISVAAPGARWTAEEWRGIDAPFVRSYEDYYSRLDPIVPFAGSWKPGTLLTDYAMVSNSVRGHSEFYQDWVRPQGIRSIAVANFLGEDGVVGILGAPRACSTPFRHDQLEVLTALLPLIRHAVRVRRCLAGASLRERVESDALSALSHGIVIVDKDAHILFANLAAERLLSAAAGLRAGPTGLGTLAASSTKTLRALISKATCNDRQLLGGGALLVERPPPAGPLVVLVSPLGVRDDRIDVARKVRAAMLLIINPRDGSSDLDGLLNSLFNLTPAEIRVTREVGQGGSLKDIAGMLGVMPSTIRTHLHHIFAKTGMRRQADLIRLVAQFSIARGFEVENARQP
jgi:DNA-binding CsgD family transcriptional regulator/PAS domain-containing protein